jgi:hypothetical protein
LCASTSNSSGCVCFFRTCPARCTELMVEYRKMTRTTSYPTAFGRSSSSTGRTMQGYDAS